MSSYFERFAEHESERIETSKRMRSMDEEGRRIKLEAVRNDVLDLRQSDGGTSPKEIFSILDAELCNEFIEFMEERGFPRSEKLRYGIHSRPPYPFILDPFENRRKLTTLWSGNGYYIGTVSGEALYFHEERYELTEETVTRYAYICSDGKLRSYGRGALSPMPVDKSGKYLKPKIGYSEVKPWEGGWDGRGPPPSDVIFHHKNLDWRLKQIIRSTL